MAGGYPFNVSEGESYSIYVDVKNHMGMSAYYDVQVKFRNQTDEMPNETAGLPSPLSSLYEYRLFLQDGQSWEKPLTFSFSRVSAGQNASVIGDLTVNGATIGVDKPAEWDSINKGFFYELFMELWIYNVTVDAFQYHNRFVWTWLNMSIPS
jgi:hypothetical protein